MADKYDPLAIQQGLLHASLAQLIDLRVCVIAAIADKLVGDPQGLDPVFAPLGERLFMLCAIEYPDCLKELKALTDAREKAMEGDLAK